MLDAGGRPYFLWDVDVDVSAFRALLSDPDPAVRGYWLAKLMRQAKPDDVFSFTTWPTIVAEWDRIERHLGKSRAFWTWLRGMWG